LSSLADRDVQRGHIQRIVERAGATLTPLAAYMLVRIDRAHEASPFVAAHERGISLERVAEALAELRQKGLVRQDGDVQLRLTDPGCDVLDRLVAARRAHLNELAAEWTTGSTEDETTFLRDAVRDLVPTANRVGL
jgi:DNA-binding MarR family transcriptional regulator